ncbi:MAG: hypothetical protein QOG30_2270, partial [Acidimicrobiaceae bacterium]
LEASSAEDVLGRIEQQVTGALAPSLLRHSLGHRDILHVKAPLTVRYRPVS